MKNIEKFENLPFHEGRSEYLTRVYGNMWDIKKFDHSWYRSDKTLYSWFKAKCVIKKFLGKSFDKAFSYYCTLVPIYEQKEFFKLFTYKRHHYKSEYLINEGGNIINSEKFIYKRKSKYTLKSIDYEEGYYHKVTKRKVTIKEYDEDEKKNWDLPYEKYIPIILKGYERTFDSKNDKEYKRMHAELIKAKKLNSRIQKKYGDYFSTKTQTDQKSI